MSLVLHCENFLFKKESYRRVLFGIVIVALLGGLIGAAISLPLSVVHVTSFTMKFATTNDGTTQPHSLISTRPVYIYSRFDLTKMEVDVDRSPECENNGQKIRISMAAQGRGTNEVEISISTQKKALGCAEVLGKALVIDQNRRLAEYIDLWLREEKILTRHYEDSAERERESLRINPYFLAVDNTKARVFEELYKVKWLVASTREAAILAPPSSKLRRVVSEIFLHGFYGLIIACSSSLVILFVFWVMLLRQRKIQSSKDLK
jgi:hypothetical protein